MANVILATPVISDAATLSGSLSVGDMALQNLKAMNLYQKYRTKDLSAVINVDLLTAQPVDFVSVIAHNATSSGTVTVSAGSTIAASDYSSGPLSLITGDNVGFDRNVFAVKFATQTYRYWKLAFSDISNPDGYLEMGRLYLSNCFQPNKNAIYGMEEGYTDDSRTAWTVSGGISSVPRMPRKTARWTLDFATSLEMYSQARDIDKTRGTSKDILFIPDIEDTNYFQERAIYGKMNGLAPVISAAYSIYQKSYDIEEIL